jgi:hypothetical protein
VILRHARVADLKADADELAEICRGLERSPDCLRLELWTEPRERELQLLALLLFERERSRILLALLAG